MHVAGNSLGGWMALELARRGRVLSVTAISPAGAWDKLVGARARHAARARRAMSRLRLSRWRLPRLARARRMLLLAAMQRGDLMPATAAAAFLEDACACAVFDDLLVAILAEGPIRAPVTVPGDCRVRIVWGTADRVIPFEPFGRLMLESVPAAEQQVLEGLGHLPIYDDPEAVADAILETTLSTS